MGYNTRAVPSWVTIRPNSRSAPHFRLAEEASAATKCMLLQLAPAPSTKRRRAGMLVTKVPMNNHPKIRPVRRTSTIDSLRQAVGAIVTNQSSEDAHPHGWNLNRLHALDHAAT